MKASNLLAAIAAMFGGQIGGSLNPLGLPLHGALPRHSATGRVTRLRTPGPARPAGSKLARAAEKSKVGLATLR